MSSDRRIRAIVGAFVYLLAGAAFAVAVTGDRPDGRVAQLEEHRGSNPRVAGSSPATATTWTAATEGCGPFLIPSAGGVR